jgi:nucleotide-binding universal stress UspA family protein
MTEARALHKILVAVAGPDDQADTIPLVLGLAQAFSAEVLVVHLRERVVAAGGTIEKETIEESVDFGLRVAEDLVQLGVKATADINAEAPDHVADYILDKASEFEADLIVIGAHRAHGLRERMFGDIGRTLVHRSLCPILLMPSVGE